MNEYVYVYVYMWNVCVYVGKHTISVLVHVCVYKCACVFPREYEYEPVFVSVPVPECACACVSCTLKESIKDVLWIFAIEAGRSWSSNEKQKKQQQQLHELAGAANGHTHTQWGILFFSPIVRKIVTVNRAKLLTVKCVWECENNKNEIKKKNEIKLKKGKEKLHKVCAKFKRKAKSSIKVWNFNTGEKKTTTHTPHSHRDTHTRIGEE